VSALEGALPTAAPNEGWKLSDSVVGVRIRTPPMASHLPAVPPGNGHDIHWYRRLAG